MANNEIGVRQQNKTNRDHALVNLENFKAKTRGMKKITTVTVEGCKTTIKEVYINTNKKKQD